jgi:DNA-binding HxlR family transcriptional regulator
MKWRLGRIRLHRRRTVLHALAQVGPAGMTPNSLEVTTELTEPLLNATLEELMQAGLVTQRVDDGLLTDLHDKPYLPAEHESPQH